MFSQRISNCFDSHVHWLATGEVAERLSLHGLKSAEQVNTLKVEMYHWRGEWLLGFGWDQNHWPNQAFPDRHILDQVFGTERPVAFSRADGHALWVNTVALQKAGLMSANIKDPQGGRIVRDAQGFPTGVLIDTAMLAVDACIPVRSATDTRRALLKGMQIFNQAGFTHIRDLSCSALQWEESLKLEQSGVLTLAVEQFFSVEEGQDFAMALKLARQARQNKTKRLRVMGVKAYVDGALGSEGAWLSCPYHSGSGLGLQLFSMDQIKQMMRETWSHGLDLAVHTIGDEAAHQTVLSYHELAQQGVHGRLHLEHAELLRPETVALMVGQNIRCHLQPCHWLSDRAWLSQKIGDLQKYAFPWRALQEAKVIFDFGSDSPIERPSLLDNLRALETSATQGVAPLLGDPLKYHSHSDSAWVANTYTVFADGVPTEVVYNGEHLL
ncbi:MAG: amidohydrolase [Bdellovibrionales bacterium]